MSFEDVLGPINIEVNLSGAWDTESEAEILIETLKSRGLYKNNLLFCGFNAQKPFRTTGNIFVAKENNLRFGGSSDSSANNPIQYALDKEVPAIAVIDSDKIIDIPKEKGLGDEVGYEIEISDPSAVIAIVFLK